MKNYLMDGRCGSPAVLNTPSFFDPTLVERANKLLLKLDPTRDTPRAVEHFTISEAVAVLEKKISVGFLKKNKIEYKTNSIELRSDELSHELAASNFLFAGCSFTYGEGLPLDLVWSYRLNTELHMHSDMKYFSIAYRGGSIDYILNALEDYLEIYGNPKAIFALFPSPLRRLREYNEKESRYGVALPPPLSGSAASEDLARYIKDVWPECKSEKDVHRHNYRLIAAFQEACEQKGVKLFWGTWDYRFRTYINSIEADNDLYVDLDVGKVEKKQDSITDKNKLYYYQARDTYHPGAGYHSAVKNLFKEKYENTKSSD